MTLPSGPGDTRPDLFASLGLMGLLALVLGLPVALLVEAASRPAAPGWATWLGCSSALFLLLLALDRVARRR